MILTGLKKGFTTNTKEALSIISTVVVSLLISVYFLPKQLELAAAALITFSLRDRMLSFLEENRISIWEKHVSPYEANARLTAQFIALFLFIFTTAFALYFFYLPNEAALLFNCCRNELGALFEHNLEVLLGFFIFAALYKSAGLMFILAWNALHWASSISSVFERFFHYGIGKAFTFIGSILPHLLFEAIAYILAGMAGVFLSKAVRKYSLTSPEFFRVSRASLVVFIVSIAVLGAAALSEFCIAQNVFKSLR